MIRIRIESNKYKPHNDKFFFFFEPTVTVFIVVGFSYERLSLPAHTLLRSKHNYFTPFEFPLAKIIATSEFFII